VDQTHGLHAADHIDISPEADQIASLDGVSDMRMDRIAEIRQQIAAGVYETTEKLDVAVGRLLDELVG
jgi:negative regulator of flagellin synthesis FlgM